MYEECPSSRTSRCTLCLLFQLVAGVVCSNALLLRCRPVRQSLTCESEAAGYLVGEVQTTKGEAGDNRIGDQVRTVSVINDTQRSKREKMAERERNMEMEMEMEMDGFLRLDMGLGATKGDPGKVGMAERLRKCKGCATAPSVTTACDQLPVSRSWQVRIEVYF